MTRLCMYVHTRVRVILLLMVVLAIGTGSVHQRLEYTQAATWRGWRGMNNAS